MSLEVQITPRNGSSRCTDPDGTGQTIQAIRTTGDAPPTNGEKARLLEELQGAAGQGLTWGHAGLGHLYADGWLVEQSAMMAVAHFLSASALGDRSVFQIARELADDLTPRQANLARALAYVFVNNKS